MRSRVAPRWMSSRQGIPVVLLSVGVLALRRWRGCLGVCVRDAAAGRSSADLHRVRCSLGFPSASPVGRNSDSRYACLTLVDCLPQPTQKQTLDAAFVKLISPKTYALLVQKVSPDLQHVVIVPAGPLHPSPHRTNRLGQECIVSVSCCSCPCVETLDQKWKFRAMWRCKFSPRGAETADSVWKG